MELFLLVNRKGKCCNGVFANKSYNLLNVCAECGAMTKKFNFFYGWVCAKSISPNKIRGIMTFWVVQFFFHRPLAYELKI